MRDVIPTVEVVCATETGDCRGSITNDQEQGDHIRSTASDGGALVNDLLTAIANLLNGILG